MTEWGVFLVMVSLMGFAATIVGPIIKLNTSITTLTVTMQAMEEALNALSDKNSTAHRNLWEKTREQDAVLQTHEKRITLLEGHK